MKNERQLRQQPVERLIARSAAELVLRLNQTSRIPKRSVRLYMETVSTMHEAAFGVRLHTGSAEAFVLDLLDRGMLVRDGACYSILF